MANKKLIPSIGKKFGKWTVISESTIYLGGNTKWMCECDCGNKSSVAMNNLMNGNSTQCQRCSAKERGLKKRKGLGKISGEMWNQITRSKSVDITIQEAWDIFVSQNSKCAVSGREIEIYGYPYDKEKTTAILCRKNIDDYYWLHKDVSNLKPFAIAHDDWFRLIIEVANYQINEEK
jgi:hypothetical protein